MGKFYIALAGLGSNLLTLVIILILNSVIGLYYYLRIIVTLFSTGGVSRNFLKWVSPDMWCWDSL